MKKKVIFTFVVVAQIVKFQTWFIILSLGFVARLSQFELQIIFKRFEGDDNWRQYILLIRRIKIVGKHCLFVIVASTLVDWCRCFHVCWSKHHHHACLPKIVHNFNMIKFLLLFRFHKIPSRLMTFFHFN